MHVLDADQFYGQDVGAMQTANSGYRLVSGLDVGCCCERVSIRSGGRTVANEMAANFLSRSLIPKTCSG